jgi:threonine aldolase
MFTSRSLCDAAHAAGYRVHVDGARFANAVAALGCDPRELAGGAGVDALSFGGTKNGLAFGEAVCFFPQGDGAAYRRATATFDFHRKSTGHLLSKHRFVSAPFAATLRDGTWLRHAAHANAMGRRLADGLAAAGVTTRFPVEANGAFVVLSEELDAGLRAAGHECYPFGDPDWRMFRLMCSFDTQPEDVDGLLADIAAVQGAVGAG